MKKNSITNMMISAKAKSLIILMLLLPAPLLAQIDIIPFTGINSTRVKYFDYIKGGNYGMIGIELEARFRPKQFSPVHISLVSGVNYLSNGFYRDSGISVPGLILTSGISDFKAKYLRIPAGLKINWQPFPLIEEWRLFLGIAVSSDILLKSKLTERETEVTAPLGILTSPPPTQSYEDSGDITKYGNNLSKFLRIEIGARFRRLQFAYRLSYSMDDMHHHGLESVWNIPAETSSYFSPFELNGKRMEKYTELMVGFVIN